MRFRRDMALVLAASEWPGRDVASLEAVADESVRLLERLPDVTAAGVAVAETLARATLAARGGHASAASPVTTLDRLRRSRVPGVAEYLTLLRSVVVVSGAEAQA